jgi:hypothetical protein
MQHDLGRPLGRVLVLDLETEPDGSASGLAESGERMRRQALHRIQAVSMLRATESGDGGWEFALTSAEDAREDPLLEAIGRDLDWLAQDAGLLATYAGRQHDLGIIRRRALANWRFDLRPIAGLHDVRHIDLMVDVEPGRPSPWSSLRDSCAALGIATDHMLTSRTGRPISRRVRKGQVDVVATFLLLLHEVALARGSAAALLSGWTALARHLARPEVRAPHLEQFRHHPRIPAPTG